MKTERVGRYVLPDLATPRVDFDRAVNQRIPWPEDEEPPSSDSAARENDVVEP
jgi:hypothetical protein